MAKKGSGWLSVVMWAQQLQKESEGKKGEGRAIRFYRGKQTIKKETTIKEGK